MPLPIDILKEELHRLLIDEARALNTAAMLNEGKAPHAAVMAAIHRADEIRSARVKLTEAIERATGG